MSELDWDLIVKVHMKGTFSVTRAAWNIMREKNYGRIINTGSSSGLFGSFGQVNYAAAKMAMHGFTQSLAKEGAKRNIKVNTIVPIAGTRMTETVMPKELIQALKPDYVAPLVAYLSHDECPESGQLYEVGAGFIAKLRWERTKGHQFRPADLTTESIKSNWSKIVDFTDADHPASADELLTKVMGKLQEAEEEKPQAAAASSLKSDAIFGMMSTYLSQGNGKAQVSKVAAVFGFDIILKKGGKVEGSFTIDLKNGQGNCVRGKPEKADA